MFKVSKEIVEKITPINADHLQLATIRGWDVIVTKSVQVGDELIYFPIDSVLPEALENKIFAGTKVKLNNHRVRATKIRGAYSYGLTCPPSLIDINCDIGQDIADKLGVKKYEPIQSSIPSVMKNGKVLHGFKQNPNFIVYPKFYHYRDSKEKFVDTTLFLVSEKRHGSNVRFAMVDRFKPSILDRILIKIGLKSKFEWCIGSHNVQRHPEGDDIYCKMARKYNMKDICTKYPNWIFFGEVIGEGIQANYSYGLKDHEVHIFDIISPEREYMSQDIVREICIENNLPYCKTFYMDQPPTTFGTSSLDGKTVQEGWVIRDSKYQNRIAKIINPEYLLKDQSDFH